MPTFEITLPDGRELEIDAPNEMAAAEGAATWAKKNRQTSTAKDVAKSIGAGIARGVGGTLDALQMATGQGFAAQNANAMLKAAGAKDRVQTAGSIAEAAGGRYSPQTVAGRWAKTAGEMLPNALMPGGLLARGAAVVLPTIGAQGAEEGARALGGGETAQGVARVVGGVVGGLASGIRRNPMASVARREQSALRKLGNQARQQPNEMLARAQEFRGAGVNPVLADVVDESGRGVVRAAASRMTPARSKAQAFAEERAVSLQDRLSEQSRRHMSSDPRTPDQIRTETAAARRTRGNEQFGAVQTEAVIIPDDVRLALTSDDGREAIMQAARNVRSGTSLADRTLAEEFDLLTQTLGQKDGARISVGASQKISEALYDAAETAARTGQRNRSRILNELAESVRSNARSKVQGYDKALSDWEADSKLIEAAKLGEQFMARNTDEFVAQAANLSDEERELARAAARRAVERASGENPSAAPGVARRLSVGREQGQRNAALLGDDAADFETAMRLEEEAVKTGRYIAPNIGPQTFNRGEDAMRVAGDIVETGTAIATNRPIVATLSAARIFLKGQRLSDNEAEALVNLAIDPARTDEAVRMLAERIGETRAQAFVRVLQGPAARTAITSGALAVETN